MLSSGLFAPIADQIFDEIKPTAVISGMALGWDQIIAEAAIRHNISLVAAVPFKGQEKMWPMTSQDHYHKLMALADRVHIISEGGYSHLAMQARNEWMVDNCTFLAAWWNGSRGGTANCIEYAEKVDRKWKNYFQLI